MRTGIWVCGAVVGSLLTGCVSAASHMQDLHSAEERRMTVGIVQKEIRNGMSQADVAEALGAPNIVTKDGTDLETWVYDKIATEASYSRDEGGVMGAAGVAGAPGSVLLLGLGAGNYNKSAGASASTERTLTVVIRFDRNGRVQSSRYHSSSF